MSENSGKNLDSLNGMMTNGVIAVVVTLGAFGLYYSYMSQPPKPSPPAASSYQSQSGNQLQPFRPPTREDFEMIQKELQEQQKFQEEGRKKFGTVPGRITN